MVVGIVPTMLLEYKFRKVRKDNSPIDVDRVPVKDEEICSILITLELLSQVTPAQFEVDPEHTLPAVGTPLLQVHPLTPPKPAARLHIAIIKNI